MRILLDHCVPKPFGKLLPAHEVKTAAQMGWETLRNGVLLAEAAKSFEVFLTVDKNLRHQQDLKSLPLPILVLLTVANTPEALAPFAPFVEQVLSTIRPGQLIEIQPSGSVNEVAAGHP